jgi:hypothetical protein
MKLSFFLALILIASPAFGQSRTPVRPTKTGDDIGYVTMGRDRSLQMWLNSIDCNGKIAEGDLHVLPIDSNYHDILDHVGGLVPGQTKRVTAWPTPPCQSK